MECPPATTCWILFVPLPIEASIPNYHSQEAKPLAELAEFHLVAGGGSKVPPRFVAGQVAEATMFVVPMSAASKFAASKSVGAKSAASASVAPMPAEVKFVEAAIDPLEAIVPILALDLVESLALDFRWR